MARLRLGKEKAAQLAAASSGPSTPSEQESSKPPASSRPDAPAAKGAEKKGRKITTHTFSLDGNLVRGGAAAGKATSAKAASTKATAAESTSAEAAAGGAVWSAAAASASRVRTVRILATSPLCDWSREPREAPPLSVSRFGQVAVVGAPNAGKSSLVNALLDRKFAIVSRKQQATRKRVAGILTVGDAQVALVDTPGLFPPRLHDRLARPFPELVTSTVQSLEEHDHILFVADLARRPGPDVDFALSTLAGFGGDRLSLVLSKTDLIGGSEDARQRAAAAEALFMGKAKFSRVFRVSTERPWTFAPLREHLLAHARLGSPWQYPSNQVGDITAGDAACEALRERLLNFCHTEVPYVSAVDVASWECTPHDGRLHIVLRVLVPRLKLQEFVVGRDGSTIRCIRESTQVALEKLFSCSVSLVVKVVVKERVQAAGTDGGAFSAGQMPAQAALARSLPVEDVLAENLEDLDEPGNFSTKT